MRAKLISESLDKYSFEKKSDPLDSLGVGKKVLISKWLDEMDVEYYIINDDFTIDTEESVNINNKKLVELPDYIKFNDIYGWFDCANNQLISMRGFPERTEGGVYASDNKITSLEGCTKYIGGSLDLRNNPIKFTKEDILKVSRISRNIAL
jgi:hypothetical protein